MPSVEIDTHKKVIVHLKPIDKFELEQTGVIQADENYFVCRTYDGRDVVCKIVNSKIKYEKKDN